MGNMRDLPKGYPDEIPTLNWPMPVQRADQTWQRVWELELIDHAFDKSEISNLEAELSNKDADVHLKVSGTLLHIEVNTTRWALDDDLLLYFRKVLGVVDERIGRIATIQGHPRDLWKPASLKEFDLESYQKSRVDNDR
jgi:hypothetical protein